MGNEIEKNWLC